MYSRNVCQAHDSLTQRWSLKHRCIYVQVQGSHFASFTELIHKIRDMKPTSHLTFLLLALPNEKVIDHHVN